MSTCNSSKIILNRLELVKIKSREISKQEITVVEMTSNQSICSQKNSIKCETPSDLLKMSDMNQNIL